MRKKKNFNRLHLIALIGAMSLAWSSCYKDKGDYDINMPETPVVTGLDSIYEAVVGDSLIITPTIGMENPAEIALGWRISVPESETGYLNYTGPSLRMLFGLQANRYNVRLTVYNKTNGIKYFHTFNIQGITEFATGTSVLSVEDGITQFSFIKPDGTVQARLYEAINGKVLPPDPMHLFYMKNQLTGNTPLGYWIVAKSGGVRLNVSNMLEDPTYPNTLADNFFLAPNTLEVGSVEQHRQGVLMGIINGKFYGGTTSTWDQATTYGMFGSYAAGEYELAPSFVMSNVNNSTTFVAFEKNERQFLRINLYGSPSYYGTQYTATNTGIFDPTNVGMDLLQLLQINNGDCYAYCLASDGTVHELKFTFNFNGPFTFSPAHKRPFVRQDLVGDDTKWRAAKNGVIYIGAGNKVYRYNPLNEEIRELDTSFDNHEVTMLKLSDDENILMVGAGTSIYYLDISTGKYGVLTKEIEGIPGYPVDMAWR